jgi:hypothetical protein
MTLTRKRIILTTAGLLAATGLVSSAMPAHADFTPRPGFSPVTRSPWIPPTTSVSPIPSGTPSNAVTPGPSASATSVVLSSHCR